MDSDFCGVIVYSDAGPVCYFQRQTCTEQKWTHFVLKSHLYKIPKIFMTMQVQYLIKTLHSNFFTRIDISKNLKKFLLKCFLCTVNIYHSKSASKQKKNRFLINS